MPSATLPPRSNLRPPPPSSPPRSKLPTEDINNNYISDKYKTFPRKLSPGDISAPQKPMPPIPNEQEDYEPVILSDPENYNALDEMNDSDSDEMYEEIDEHKIQSAFRPAPVTPPRKGSKDLQINSFPTPRSRLPSNPVPIKRPPKQLPVRAESVKEVKKERRQSDANVMKPDRAPPPPPPTSLSKTSTSDEINVKPRASSEEVVAPPRRCYPRQQSSPADIEVMKEMQGFLKSNQNGLQPPNKEVTNVSRSPIPKTATPLLTSSSRPLLSTSPRPPLLREEKRKYKSLEEDDVFSNMKTKTEEYLKPLEHQANIVEVEVQYTFVSKVQIPHGSTLSQIESIIKMERVPEKVELCYTDDLGRQQTLTDSKLNVLFGDEAKRKKKIYCFPS